jgi:hypothetical protein
MPLVKEFLYRIMIYHIKPFQRISLVAVIITMSLVVPVEFTLTMSKILYKISLKFNNKADNILMAIVIVTVNL